MTLKLNLTPELESCLIKQAEIEGVSVESYAVEILTKHLFADERREKLVDLLQNWIEETEPQEQQETGEYLIKALDNDRLSDRQLFPDELKGVTW
ncbi:hypothetical protein NG798_18135 [Ancylothrix sp. C2]|uniref:hypothetical protein n=1 Tax=Ancylothrix sp. D3o TaxID=2953691 RepID=UPI0021BAFA6B|nr:hypothetical protein [Ancylothrix sp. D3o]MCT7951726.1 hypothetical protein [Ancylothrix sp. D3o]